MRYRCADCAGVFPSDGFYHIKGKRPHRDVYCKSCRKRRVTQGRTIEQTRAAQARYVAKHGREFINRRERARKNGLPTPTQ